MAVLAAMTHAAILTCYAENKSDDGCKYYRWSTQMHHCWRDRPGSHSCPLREGSCPNQHQAALLSTQAIPIPTPIVYYISNSNADVLSWKRWVWTASSVSGALINRTGASSNRIVTQEQHALIHGFPAARSWLSLLMGSNLTGDLISFVCACLPQR